MDKNTKSIIRRILSDIRVELGDEFDRNFERQAFLMMSGHEGKPDTSGRYDLGGYRHTPA